MQPKLRNQSIDYGNKIEIDRAIDNYLVECEESLGIIKQQAIQQGDELVKQVKDLDKINTKVEYNTTKLSLLNTKLNMRI